MRLPETEAWSSDGPHFMLMGYTIHKHIADLRSFHALIRVGRSFVVRLQMMDTRQCAMHLVYLPAKYYILLTYIQITYEAHKIIFSNHIQLILAGHQYFSYCTPSWPAMEVHVCLWHVSM